MKFKNFYDKIYSYNSERKEVNHGNPGEVRNNLHENIIGIQDIRVGDFPMFTLRIRVKNWELYTKFNTFKIYNSIFG